jgi:hypothetical protein
MNELIKSLACAQVEPRETFAFLHGCCFAYIAARIGRAFNAQAFLILVKPFETEAVKDTRRAWGRARALRTSFAAASVNMRGNHVESRIALAVTYDFRHLLSTHHRPELLSQV